VKLRSVGTKIGGEWYTLSRSGSLGNAVVTGFECRQKQEIFSPKRPFRHWAHPDSCGMGTGGRSTVIMLTNHLHPVTRIRMEGAWSWVGLSHRKGKKIYRSYVVWVIHLREMCGMLMTQSVYELRISLATWRPAPSGLLWRCLSSVLSRGIQLQPMASLRAQNLFLLENGALKFD